MAALDPKYEFTFAGGGPTVGALNAAAGAPLLTVAAVHYLYVASGGSLPAAPGAPNRYVIPWTDVDIAVLKVHNMHTATHGTQCAGRITNLRALHDAFQRDVDSALIIDEATDLFDDDDMPPVERAAIAEEEDDDDETPAPPPWTTQAQAEGTECTVPMQTDGAEDEEDEGAAERDRERRLRTLGMSGQAPPLTVWPLRLAGSSRVDGAEVDDTLVESALERWSDVQLSALTEVRAPLFGLRTHA